MSWKPSYPCVNCGNPRGTAHERDCPIAALRSCIESIHLIEQQYLGDGIRFDDWTHPANSLRQAAAALAKHDPSEVRP